MSEMKKWLSDKENLVAVTALKIIGVVIAFLVIIVIAGVYLSTFGFYRTRASYEEYLHSLEEYAPAGSPIDHIEVQTDFSDDGLTYRMHTTVWIFVTEDMRSDTDREALLKLYPYDQEIKGMLTSMREKSGFGSWSDKYLIHTLFVLNWKPVSLDEQMSITYMVLGDSLQKYEIGDTSFVKYLPGPERTEYSYEISDDQLISFEKE